MTVHRLCALFGTLLLAGVVPARAQQPGATAASTGATAAIPVRVEVVIARYQGDDRLSRTPFTLFTNATAPGSRGEQPTRLRVGVEVPIVSLQLSPDPKPGGNAEPASAIQYRPFGTNIDCSASTLENGRFSLALSIEDSAPFSEPDKAGASSATTPPRSAVANPVFRSFRVSNTLMLRDGQSTQFSAWTDRFSGESVRLEVTLSVVK